MKSIFYGGGNNSDKLQQMRQAQLSGWGGPAQQGLGAAEIWIIRVIKATLPFLTERIHQNNEKHRDGNDGDDEWKRHRGQKPAGLEPVRQLRPGSPRS